MRRSPPCPLPRRIACWFQETFPGLLWHTQVAKRVLRRSVEPVSTLAFCRTGLVGPSNRFSASRLSVPPLAWRRLCDQFLTPFLAVFIRKACRDKRTRPYVRTLNPSCLQLNRFLSCCFSFSPMFKLPRIFFPEPEVPPFLHLPIPDLRFLEVFQRESMRSQFPPSPLLHKDPTHPIYTGLCSRA